jgi:hypothetical protein
LLQWLIALWSDQRQSGNLSRHRVGLGQWSDQLYVRWIANWASIVELDEDLAAWGFETTIMVPFVAESEGIRQAAASASIAALDALFGSRDEKVWRRDVLLRNHTLLSVVTMPDELFYPAAQKQVAGVIVKKGQPHPKNQPVFWGRIERDGHLKVKSKRLPAQELRPPRFEVDQVPAILTPLRAFIAAPGATSINVPRLCKSAPIDYDDPLLELLPEAYVDSEPPSPDDLAKAVDDMVRETAAFLVRFGKESRAGNYDEAN